MNQEIGIRGLGAHKDIEVAIAGLDAACKGSEHPHRQHALWLPFMLELTQLGKNGASICSECRTAHAPPFLVRLREQQD